MAANHQSQASMLFPGYATALLPAATRYKADWQDQAWCYRGIIAALAGGTLDVMTFVTIGSKTLSLAAKGAKTMSWTAIGTKTHDMVTRGV